MSARDGGQWAAPIREAVESKFIYLVIDATPKPVLVAIELVRPRGKIILAEVKWGNAVNDSVSDRVVLNEITVRGVLAASPISFRKALNLLSARRHPLHLLCTHQLSA